MSKIILFDVETAPTIAATFSLYPERISHDSILQDQYIICACWKDLGKSKVYQTSLLDDPKRFKKNSNDDYHVVKTLRNALATADIAIGHNSKAFDRRKLNARLIYHGLDPLPTITDLDTLKQSRKIADFSSHRLDYLGKHLLGRGKVETQKGLWLEVLKGNQKAIRDMVKYCAGDVKLLEEVYLKLRPFMDTHPHINPANRDHSCPKCGSTDLLNSKIRYSAAGVKKTQYQCGKCHGYSTFNSKE